MSWRTAWIKGLVRVQGVRPIFSIRASAAPLMRAESRLAVCGSGSSRMPTAKPTGLGLVSFAAGMREETDPQTASLDSARMRGAADALMEKIGLTPWTRTSPFIQAVRQLIRSRVDEQDWEAAWQAGYALTLDEAIELAYQLGKGEAL